MLLNFNKEYGADRKDYRAGMDLDPDEEEMKDVIIDDKRERHWKMVFEDND